jgi:hypothetical protein
VLGFAALVERVVNARVRHAGAIRSAFLHEEAETSQSPRRRLRRVARMPVRRGDIEQSGDKRQLYGKVSFLQRDKAARSLF